MSTGAITSASGVGMHYSAVVYCEGARVEGPPPARTRFLERKLEEAYTRVVCGCDRRAEVSCRTSGLNVRVNETQVANIAFLLSEVLADPQSDQCLVEETDKYLNSISDRWIVVVINVNNIFAFKRGTTRKERKCVVSKMTEEVIEINRRADEKFAECPCSCTEKGKKCKKQKHKNHSESDDWSD